jgi:hypothetical protein
MAQVLAFFWRAKFFLCLNQNLVIILFYKREKGRDRGRERRNQTERQNRIKE